MKFTVTVLMLFVLLLSPALAASAEYAQITQEEAYALMTGEEEVIILDVRRPDEYAQGHIPNAINVPNETITDTEPEALPDKDATILVYCRSGRRSKDAAEKLAAMGYTDIREFGGIMTWAHEVVTEG